MGTQMKFDWKVLVQVSWLLNWKLWPGLGNPKSKFMTENRKRLLKAAFVPLFPDMDKMVSLQF